MSDQTCEVCGKPATRVVGDVENIPDDTYCCIEPECPPWFLCEEHAAGAGEHYPPSPSDYRKQLLAFLARIDQDIADTEAIIKTIDSDNMQLATDVRELLERIRDGVERKLNNATQQ